MGGIFKFAALAMTNPVELESPAFGKSLEEASTQATRMVRIFIIKRLKLIIMKKHKRRQLFLSNSKPLPASGKSCGV